VLPSTTSLYGLSYKEGASKLAFHHAPVGAHTATGQEIHAGQTQGINTAGGVITGVELRTGAVENTEAPAARPGLVGPPAMDDARIQELNRIGRDPLARTKRVYYQRAAEWFNF
jgi:hypothetical protein